MAFVPYAPAEYVGDAIETDFAMGWSYVRSSHVEVYVDDVENTDWEFITNGTLIRFDDPPADQTAISIIRNTPVEPSVNFASGGNIIEVDLDDALLQVTYRQEEDVYNSITGMGKGGGAQWDAEGLRITDVDDPIADTDVATQGSIADQVTAAETAETGAEAAQAAAEAAQTAAETAETNAETAETAAELAQTEAEAAAAIFPDPTAGDALSMIRVNAGATAYEQGFPAPDYETSPIAPTPGVDSVAGHGLTTVRFFQVVLQCVTGEQGWTAGDEVPLGCQGHDATFGATVAVGTTWIRWAVASSGIILVEFDAPNAGFVITTANWKIIIRVWGDA
jgi:hypothetical protein